LDDIDYIYHEKISYDNPFVPVKVYLHQKPDDVWNDWHVHKQVELLYIIKGGLDVYVEQQRFDLRDHDVVLIGPNQLHRDHAHKAEYIVFQFDCSQYADATTLPYFSMFTEPNAALSRLNYIFAENPRARDEVVRCIMDIFTEMNDKAYGYELAVSSYIRRLLQTLLRYDSRHLLTMRAADIARLKPVLDYIETNLASKISVTDACKMVNISYSHFVTYFKKVVGMSFVDYVNYRKIKMAERILLLEDRNVEEVGNIVGMENRGHFYRIFRKFNQCSPREFRLKMMGLSGQLQKLRKI